MADKGQDPRNFNYQAPLLNAQSVEDDFSELNYWVRLSDPRPRVLYPRAQGLGGCTLHHALVTSPLFTSADFGFIQQQTGDKSWDTDSMHEIWRSMTNTTYSPLYGNPCRHGYHGWLTTSQISLQALPQEVDPMISIPLQAMFDMNMPNLNPTLDPNCAYSRDSEGIHVMVKSTRDGKRVGVNQLVKLTQKKHPNLVVQLNTMVTRVIITNGVAVGVEVRTGPNQFAVG